MGNYLTKGKHFVSHDREDNLDKVIKKCSPQKYTNPYDDNVAQNIPEIMKSELT